MLQRIQSVYLFLAFALCVATFFVPLFYYAGADGAENAVVISQLFPTGWYIGYALMFFLAMSLVLSVVAFFGYKNRTNQLRVTRSLMWGLLLIYVALSLAYFFSFKDVACTPAVGMFLPLGAMVCTFLARRGIKRDIKLVRDSERIR